MPPAPQPASIGRYQVERLLGQGAMGTIWLAHDPVIGRKVAIKLVRTDLLGGGDFAKSAPQISTPMIIGGQMSFHLSTAQGALPTAKITVRIGGTDVPAESIRRIGTLITFPLKLNGPQAVTVTYDGKPVYAANLSL